MLKILGHDSTTTEFLTQAEAAAWRRRPEARVWLDGERLSPAETAWLAAEWGVQATHLNDAAGAADSPYLDPYPDYVYGQILVPDNARLKAEPTGLSFCLGERFLITLHDTPQPILETLWAEQAAQSDRWRYGLDQLLWRLCALAGTATGGGTSELLARWRSRHRLPAIWSLPGRHAYLAEWQVTTHQWRHTIAQQAAMSDGLAGLNHRAIDANVQHHFKRMAAKLTAQGKSLAAASAGAETLQAALRQRLLGLYLAVVVTIGALLVISLNLLFRGV